MNRNTDRNKQYNKTKYAGHIIRAAAAFLIAVCVGICANPGFAGFVYAEESTGTGTETAAAGMTPEEVLVAAADPAASGGVYVYAPTIYSLDSKYLIFGNGAGLVIYDLKGKKVSGLIDLQAVDGIYYNCESMKTHVMLQNDTELTVYNTRIVAKQDTEANEEELTDEDKYMEEEPFGSYSVFDLKKMNGDGSLLTPVETGSDKARLAELMKTGADYEAAHFVETWENVSYVQKPEMTEAVDYYNSSYSERAFVNTGKGGKEYRSILFTKGEKYKEDGTVDKEVPFEYSLLTERVDSPEEKIYPLNLGITDEVKTKVNEINKLPKYSYTGSDPAIKVICESLAADEYGWHAAGESGSVVIPVPVVFDKIEKDGELLVFGNFWSEAYIRQGNTLIATSGGEMPACYHLKAVDGGAYKIVGADIAEDGEGYMDSIAKFTEGYPEIYKKYEDEEDYDENLRRETLRAYCEANKLNIKYYKDYGCDPAEL